MRHNRRKFLIACMVFIIATSSAIVSAFRLAGPGADVQEYTLLIVGRIGSIEPFWDFLRNSFDISEAQLPAFYGAISFIALTLKMPTLLKLRLAVVAAPLYLTSLYFLHEYTQIRIALGLGIAYFILSRPSHGNWVLSLFIYLLPSLFHYSLLPLALVPLLSRPRIAMVGLVMLGYVLVQAHQLELLIDLAKPKFGDDTEFNLLNVLSTYFLLIHVLFIFYLRPTLPKNFLAFHNAAIIFIMAAIPFGLFQYGTAYFRFQEISASLMLPPIFAAIGCKRGHRAVIWSVFAGGYYLLLSVKIFNDLI